MEKEQQKAEHKHSRTRSKSPPNLKTSSKARERERREQKDASSKKAEEPFSVVTPSNLGPSERYGHSAVYEETGGGLMIIFGGCDNKGAFCDDLWTYNIENNSWTKHQKKEGNVSGPTGRHFHSAVVYKQTMFVFGGASNAYYNDLYSFDLDTQLWSHIVSLDSAPPSPRYGHSAVLFGANMYIYGGFDKDGFACNEIYEFSIELTKWRVLKVEPSSSIAAKDAYYHAAVSYHGSMYVLGGYKHVTSDLLEYRFSTRTWSLVKTTGAAPSPRWGHRCVTHEGKMCVFGGRDTVRNFAGVYELDFDSFHWTKAAEGGTIAARFFCSAVAGEDRMFIFGGRNIYNFSFNDLYAYDFATERKRRPDTYVDDFHRLVNERELSDVSFHFPDEPTQPVIYAHKIILSARCAPFAAMFRVGMKEAIAGKIVIRNLKHTSFLALVEYLYTGQLYSSAETLPELLTAADMYALDHLKALCERRLIKYVDPHNAVFLFSLGDQYKALELKAHCLTIVTKSWSELKSSEQFLQLPDALKTELLTIVSQQQLQQAQQQQSTISPSSSSSANSTPTTSMNSVVSVVPSGTK